MVPRSRSMIFQAPARRTPTSAWFMVGCYTSTRRGEVGDGPEEMEVFTSGKLTVRY